MALFVALIAGETVRSAHADTPTDVGCPGGALTPADNGTALKSALPASGTATLSLTAGCTYDLSTAGLLTVPLNVSVTIEGNGATISGATGGAFSNKGTLTLSHVAFTGNHSPGTGGAIYNEGTLDEFNNLVQGILVVDSSTFTGNSSDGPYGKSGGAIYNNNGAVTVMNSTFVNNAATAGSAITNFGTTDALHAQAMLTLINDTFANTSSTVVGPIISNDAYAKASMTGGTISGATGGAISNAGTFTLSDVTVTGNQSPGTGGAIFNTGTLTIDQSVLSNNTSTGPSGAGGAIYNSYGTATVTNSTFSNNAAAGSGSTIANVGPATLNLTNDSFNNTSSAVVGSIIDNQVDAVAHLTHVTISGATGGAISNYGTFTLSYSALSQNQSPGIGGGIYNEGTVSIDHSTINDNASTGGLGGGILNGHNGQVTASNTTFASNSAGDGGAIGNFTTATLTLTNDTFANNTGGAIYNNSTGPSNAMGSIFQNNGTTCGGSTAVADGGYNVSDDSSCGFTASTDRSGSAGLGSLADNGGPTETMAITTSSLAYGLIPVTSGNCPATDQRSYIRLASGDTACDAGAFEAGATPPPTLTITASDESMTVGGALPAVTPSYTGLLNGDTAPALPPTCSADITTKTTSCTGAFDANYTITYVSGTLTIYGITIPTTTTASATYANIATGGVASITAQVTASDLANANPGDVGTVSFYNGSTLLCTVQLHNGTAVCTASIDPSFAAPHTLRAVYSGSGDFLPSGPAYTDVVPELAQPTIVSVVNANGATSPAWLLQGGGFSGASSVTVCGVSVPFTVVNDNILLAGMPSLDGPQQCAITVVAAGGTGSTAGTVTIVPAPVPGSPVIVIPTGPTTTTTPTTPACTSQTLTLTGQWTLIAWPGASGTSVADALAGDGTTCTSNVTAQIAVVWGFDAATQQWHAYFPSASNVPGANDLTTLTQGSGYFVALVNPTGGSASWMVNVAS